MTRNLRAEAMEWMAEALVDQTDGCNRQAIVELHADNWALISTAPGSTGNHHFFPGGYLEHIWQVNHNAVRLFELIDELGGMIALRQEERFTLPDLLTVTTLHDIEKPWRQQFNEQGTLVVNPRLREKSVRAQFRAGLLGRYGITLSGAQHAAMHFAEGVRDTEYSSTRRVITPMGTLVHVADLISSRVTFNVGNPGDSYPDL